MPAPTPVTSPSAPEAVGPYVHAVRHGDVRYCSGSGLENALRLTIFTTRLDAFAEINDAYAAFFGASGDDTVPARTTVGVAALPKGARVEIDAMEAVPQSGNH